jgi:hypothetical protein
MRKILRYFFNTIFLLGVSLSVHAQKGTILPSAVRVGTDLGYMGVSLFDPEKQQFEFSTDIDLYKFLLTADYGTGNWTFLHDNYDYNSSGSYFKAGVDYNLLARDPELNVIYFGVKYAKGHFSERLNYEIVDPWYYNYSKTEDKNDIKANWIEANFGMKVRVWKQLYLGWAGRIKLAKHVNADGSSLSTYYIPGYGKAESDSRWGFNYQIFYRIPFRKKPPYRPKKITEKNDTENTVPKEQ